MRDAITKRIPVSEIRPSEYNPRVDLKPGDDEYEKIKASLVEFGLVETLVVNKNTKRLIGGHQRFKIIKELGWKNVTVSLVDIQDAAKEKMLNIALNKIQGDWNRERLAKILSELDLANQKIDLTGFNSREISTILGDLTTKSAGTLDKVPAKPKKAITKPGDLWQVGRHKFLCGDSTSPGDVERLLGKAKPNLMVTDPPYGVNYESEWREKSGLGAQQKGKVRNDDRIDWSEAYKLFPGSVAYIWHAGKYESTVARNMEALGFEVISQIIWVKQHFVISRGDYHWQHEPCLYLVKKGAKHSWQSRRDQTTVWDIQNNNPFGGGDEEKFGHSTMKPVECMLRPVLNNSRKGETVYDPFLGAGTTLIACEKSNRIGYGMELDPGYCDVVIERFQRAFDIKAKKV